MLDFMMLWDSSGHNPTGLMKRTEKREQYEVQRGGGASKTRRRSKEENKEDEVEI